jgi:hypothetical protein
MNLSSSPDLRNLTPGGFEVLKSGMTSSVPGSDYFPIEAKSNLRNKFEMRNLKNQIEDSLVSLFVLRASHLFRISSFEFRISVHGHVARAAD